MKAEHLEENLFTPNTDEQENEEVQQEVSQVLLDGALGDGVADAEKLDDEGLGGVLSSFGFNSDEDSDSYFEKVTEMVNIMKTDFDASDDEIIETIRVNLEVKLAEAKQIYRDVRLFAS